MGLGLVEDGEQQATDHGHVLVELDALLAGGRAQPRQHPPGRGHGASIQVRGTFISRTVRAAWPSRITGRMSMRLVENIK
jgi:hypothetical protein